MSLSNAFSPSFLSDNLAPRHALLNAFHRAAMRRTVFVSAPAGSGKTISTLLWVRDSGRKPVWIQVNDGMNTPTDFYYVLGAGLLSTQPDNNRVRKILEGADFGADPFDNIMKCIDALKRDDDFYALVMDDMHRISDGEIWKALPRVLAALPANYVALVLSRSAPPSGSLMADKSIGRINGAQLAFTAEEIAQYFRANGRDFSDAEVTTAHALTGGWAIGVRALAISGSLTLDGKENLDTYLQKQVWENWPEDFRDSLLRFSVVEEGTAELACRLGGRDDMACILDGMCENNTFITKSGDDLYRIHHLFLDFLVAARKRSGTIDETALYAVAADYYRKYGMLYEALHCSGKAGDIRGVEECMFELYHYRSRGHSVAENARYMRTHLIDIVPDARLEESPFLLINYIWYCFLTGDAKMMFHYLDRFYANFGKILEKHKHFHALGVLISVLDCRYGIMEKAAELRKGFRPDSDAEEAQTITATENMPFFHRGHRDYSPVAPEVEKNMAPVLAMMTPIMKGATNNLFYGTVASLHFEMNDLAAARANLETAADNLEDDSATELHFCTRLLDAVITRAEGKEKEYAEAMGRLEGYLRNHATFLLPNFEAIRTKYHLMDARKTNAEAWLKQHYVVETDSPELFRIFQYLATARAHLVLGNVEKAERWLTAVRTFGVDFNRPLDVAEADTLLAAVKWVAGKRKDAVATLRKTLLSMQRHGFVRIVGEEGAAVLPILKQILDALGDKRSGGELRKNYVREVYELARSEARRHRGVTRNIGRETVKLSGRQLAVLEHLAAGRKFQAIADLTGLALPTIKAHASAAYKKLGVGNAGSAVVKARELGLLGNSSQRRY